MLVKDLQYHACSITVNLYRNAWFLLDFDSVIHPCLYSVLDTDSTKLTRCTPGNNEHTLHKVSQHKVSSFDKTYLVSFFFTAVKLSKIIIPIF